MSATLGADLVFTIFANWEMIVGRGTDRVLVAGDDWGPWWRQGHTSWQHYQRARGRVLDNNSNLLANKGTGLEGTGHICFNILGRGRVNIGYFCEQRWYNLRFLLKILVLQSDSLQVPPSLTLSKSGRWPVSVYNDVLFPPTHKAFGRVLAHQCLC